MAAASRILKHTWAGEKSAPGSAEEAHGEPRTGITAIPRIRLYVVGGTGGLLPLEARPEQSATSIGSLLIDDRSSELARTSSQKLEFIRSATRLSVTELARIFSVTRQTVHEWCQDAPLAAHNERRLQKLTDAMTLLLEAVGAVTAHDLRRPVRAGPSLLDTVRLDGNVLAAARELVDTLRRESAQRARLSVRFATRRPAAHEPSEFGSPHLRDED
jgi:DNA-binding transcriptional regulator YiaG